MEFYLFTDEEEQTWFNALPNDRQGVDQLLDYIREVRSLPAYLHFFRWTDYLHLPTIQALSITADDIAFVVEEVCENLCEEDIQTCMDATCNSTVLQAFQRKGYCISGCDTLD